jgi:nitroreductase
MIQSFQLLAWERQIGVVWKTNEYNRDPRFYEAVGIKPEEWIVATLYLGRFDKIPRSMRRTPVEQLLTFIDM